MIDLGRKYRIVCIGGGTGLVWVEALKHYSNIVIVAIVTMFDDGGSTGKGRRIFGTIMPSDPVNITLALRGSKADESLVKVINHRFHQAEFRNWRLGTLILAALLEEHNGNLSNVMDTLHRWFNVYPHSVLPVSFTPDVSISAQYRGKTITGEYRIDTAEGMEDPLDRIQKLSLVGNPFVNKEAQKELLTSDLIVLGPGSLYTSILPNVLVPGVVEAIDSSSSPIVYIVNLATVYGDTHGLTAQGHIDLINEYLGHRKVTHVLINNGRVQPSIIRSYRDEGGDILVDDITSESGLIIIRDDFLSKELVEQDPNDPVTRHPLRHDKQKIAEKIISLL